MFLRRSHDVVPRRLVLIDALTGELFGRERHRRIIVVVSQVRDVFRVGLYALRVLVVVRVLERERYSSSAARRVCSDLR